MGMVEMSFQDGIAIVKLNRGVTNALDLELVNELDIHLERIERDPEVHGLVLGSTSGKFFSIGFDIKKMFDYPRQDFEIFFRAFNRVSLRLYTLPKPTAAALTGHAVAGGCILSLCCDERFMAEGRNLMGLNEIMLGVPVPYLPDCILRDITGTRIAREVMETGRFYESMECLRMGMVDEVFPAGEVVERAVEKVRSIGGWPLQAFAGIKRNRTRDIENRVRERQEEKHRYFIDCWYSDDARRLIGEAMKKF